MPPGGTALSFVIGYNPDTGQFNRYIPADNLGLTGLRVQMLRYDTAAGEWVRWDGKIDTVVNGDLVVAVDGLEDLLSDTLQQYKISDIDNASDPSYYGYLRKDGAYYIMCRTASAGTYRYFAGASGYADAWTDRAAKVYDYFSTIF